MTASLFWVGKYGSLGWGKKWYRETRSGNLMALCAWDKELAWSYREEQERGCGGEGVVRRVLGPEHSVCVSEGG